MDLVNQIMAGVDLRIFLKPDPAWVVSRNLYCESISLPHIFIEGMTFWGHTHTHHIRLNEEGLIPFHGDKSKKFADFYASYKTGFFYSNYRGGIFGEINTESLEVIPSFSGFACINKGYSEHKWITKDNYTSISGRIAIEDAVKNGRKLKIIIEIEKECWATRSPRYYVGEVFLPYLFDSGDTFFLCSPFVYNDVSLSRRALDAIRKNKNYIQVANFCKEQYLINMNGEYIHLGDTKKWDKGKWCKTNTVKVFAETGDITMPVVPVAVEDKPIRFRDRLWKLFHTPNIV